MLRLYVTTEYPVGGTSRFLRVGFLVYLNTASRVYNRGYFRLKKDFVREQTQEWDLVCPCVSSARQKTLIPTQHNRRRKGERGAAREEK